MRVLILQNHEIGPAGLVSHRLARRGAELMTVQAWSGEAIPTAVDDYAGMVVLGGAQFAGDFVTWPYLADEATLIRRFADADRPVLGICLGAQLVARAHGAEVRKHHQLEIGYSPLRTTEHALDDPLFRNAEPSAQMQWHSDTFDLPDEAVLLATNDICRNQAMRIGRSHYGLQFHCEADRQIIDVWVADGRAELDSKHPGAVEKINRGVAAHADMAATFGARLIDGWINLIDA